MGTKYTSFFWFYQKREVSFFVCFSETVKISLWKVKLYPNKIYMQVSPTYSQEVSGNPVIAPHLHKFHGIVNGIDPDIWDPLNDKFIPVSFLGFSQLLYHL